MRTIRLHHRDVFNAGEAVHLTCATLDAGRVPSLHDHDFFELIWVESGNCRHHLADGSQDLADGDIVFVRPQDRHGLQSRQSGSQVGVVAMHPDVIAALGARHPELAGRFFWSADAEPERVSAARTGQIGLADLMCRLELSRRDTLSAEAFLLPLCAALLDQPHEGLQQLPASAPDWLVAACHAARDPVVFREGAAGFARVAGRAHPHVSRTVRRYLGESPSDYVNRQRMAHAARRLVASGESIADIAADCGIPNLSHFHKLFRIHHGTTPLQYRKARQRDLIQPA